MFFFCYDIISLPIRRPLSLTNPDRMNGNSWTPFRDPRYLALVLSTFTQICTLLKIIKY